MPEPVQCADQVQHWEPETMYPPFLDVAVPPVVADVLPAAEALRLLHQSH